MKLNGKDIRKIAKETKAIKGGDGNSLPNGAVCVAVDIDTGDVYGEFVDSANNWINYDGNTRQIRHITRAMTAKQVEEHIKRELLEEHHIECER